jgi:hypothetical protein
MSKEFDSDRVQTFRKDSVLAPLPFSMQPAAVNDILVVYEKMRPVCHAISIDSATKFHPDRIIPRIRSRAEGIRSFHINAQLACSFILDHPTFFERKETYRRTSPQNLNRELQEHTAKSTNIDLVNNWCVFCKLSGIWYLQQIFLPRKIYCRHLISKVLRKAIVVTLRSSNLMLHTLTSVPTGCNPVTLEGSFESVFDDLYARKSQRLAGMAAAILLVSGPLQRTSSFSAQCAKAFFSSKSTCMWQIGQLP